MPTQELRQEREQRSFQEVQQYFMKNLTLPYQQMGGMGGDGRGFGGQGQHRPNNYQGQRGNMRQDGRQGKYNNRGGNMKGGRQQPREQYMQ